MIESAFKSQYLDEFPDQVLVDDPLNQSDDEEEIAEV